MDALQARASAIALLDDSEPQSVLAALTHQQWLVQERLFQQDLRQKQQQAEAAEQAQRDTEPDRLRLERDEPAEKLRPLQRDRDRTQLARVAAQTRESELTQQHATSQTVHQQPQQLQQDDNTLASLHATVQEREKTLQALDASAALQQTQWQDGEKQLAALRQQRHALFGDRDTQQVRHEWRQRSEQYQQNVDKLAVTLQ